MNEDLISDCAAMTARHFTDRFGGGLCPTQQEALYKVVRAYVRAGIEAYAALERKSLITPSNN
jgi:hypothetical protein